MDKENSKKYWENYYSKNRQFNTPSGFAEFVLPFLKEDSVLIELGCGNGRDCFYFEKNRGLKIHALDQCTDEITYLAELNSSKISFHASDFTKFAEVKDFDYVYSRFTLHSVSSADEENTFEWVSEGLSKNGLFFIEVRSTNDELYGVGEQIGEHEFISDHYRRFVVMDEMIANAKKHNLVPIYALQSKGLAPHKQFDPEVIRLILGKAH